MKSFEKRGRGSTNAIDNFRGGIRRDGRFRSRVLFDRASPLVLYSRCNIESVYWRGCCLARHVWEWKRDQPREPTRSRIQRWFCSTEYMRQFSGDECNIQVIKRADDLYKLPACYGMLFVCMQNQKCCKRLPCCVCSLSRCGPERTKTYNKKAKECLHKLRHNRYFGDVYTLVCHWNTKITTDKVYRWDSLYGPFLHLLSNGSRRSEPLSLGARKF